MTEQSNRPDFFQELADELRAIPRSLRDSWSQMSTGLQNMLVRARNKQIDYIVMPLGGSLPERSAPPRGFIQRQLPLPPDPLSLETVNRRLRVIGEAENVPGVLLIFTGLGGGLAKLQSLRRTIGRLREAGKTVVVFTPSLDLPHYYVAAAANRIVAPPGADFEVLGLSSDITFLKDSLEKVGLQLDVIQISPYKSAYDNLGKSDMSAQLREQIDWLLDDNFEMIVSSLAADRGCSVDDMRALIDGAPYSTERALALGLLDAVAYEDELPYVLAEWDAPPAEVDTRSDAGGDTGTPDTDAPTDAQVDAAGSDENDGTEETPSRRRPRARLLRWQQADNLLLRRHRHVTDEYIAVISLEGGIVEGESIDPPIDLPLPFIGGQQAGDQTLTQILRRAEQREKLAAVVFQVDSPGGSALASDLIARELRRLRKKIPVVVYMGDVAASGGYYVSAYANHIVAQPGTVTGSIGVISGRLANADLLQKAGARRVALQRGARARLYRGADPLTEDEYAVFMDNIENIYGQFKQVVAEGRKLPYETLDDICLGRVWTGRQALAHGLVDSHGDLLDAVRIAAELADLPVDDHHYIPVINLHPREGGRLLPKAFDAPADLLGLLTSERLRRLSGRPLLLMPYSIRLW